MLGEKRRLLGLILLVYGLPVVLWSVVPSSRDMYGSLLDSSLFNLLFHHRFVFSALGLTADAIVIYCLYVLFLKQTLSTKDRTTLTASGLRKLLRYVFINAMHQPANISAEERVSLLAYLVKLFFVPTMLMFFIGNAHSLYVSVQQLISGAAPYLNESTLIAVYFPLIMNIILLIDVAIFAFGYLVESPRLKNVVKSVDPTALGWLVVLLCYPPTNAVTGVILSSYSQNFSNFINPAITVTMGAVSLLLFVIYVWASIALGFKASNLTNRGIVAHGPYKYVRHPAYISKNLSWLIMAIPALVEHGLIVMVAIAGTGLIYFLRALTEERHLLHDPDYVAYTRKVKYMFIPGVF